MDEDREEWIQEAEGREENACSIDDEGADEVLIDDRPTPASDFHRFDELQKIVAEKHDIR